VTRILILKSDLRQVQWTEINGEETTTMNFCTLRGKVAEYSRICRCLGRKLSISSIMAMKS